MFTKEELEILGQALANSAVKVGEARKAVQLLEKISTLLTEVEKKDKEQD